MELECLSVWNWSVCLCGTGVSVNVELECLFGTGVSVHVALEGLSMWNWSPGLTELPYTHAPEGTDP